MYYQDGPRSFLDSSKKLLLDGDVWQKNILTALSCMLLSVSMLAVCCGLQALFLPSFLGLQLPTPLLEFGGLSSISVQRYSAVDWTASMNMAFVQNGNAVRTTNTKIGSMERCRNPHGTNWFIRLTCCWLLYIFIWPSTSSPCAPATPKPVRWTIPTTSRKFQSMVQRPLLLFSAGA